MTSNANDQLDHHSLQDSSYNDRKTIISTIDAINDLYKDDPKPELLLRIIKSIINVLHLFNEDIRSRYYILNIFTLLFKSIKLILGIIGATTATLFVGLFFLTKSSAEYYSTSVVNDWAKKTAESKLNERIKILEGQEKVLASKLQESIKSLADLNDFANASMTSLKEGSNKSLLELSNSIDKMVKTKSELLDSRFEGSKKILLALESSYKTLGIKYASIPVVLTFYESNASDDPWRMAVIGDGSVNLNMTRVQLRSTGDDEVVLKDFQTKLPIEFGEILSLTYTSPDITLFDKNMSVAPYKINDNSYGIKFKKSGAAPRSSFLVNIIITYKPK